MAGPERPPVMFARWGRRRSMSTDIPVSVLIRDTASAPAASTARAISVMSVTFGVSLTIRGRSVSPRTCSRDLGGRIRTGAEGDPPFFDVRAGDVDFDTADPFSAVQDLRHAPVFVDGFTEDVGDDRNVVPPEKRQFLCDEGPDADVLEPDGVEHPGRGLHDPRRRISGASFEREPLDDDRPQSVQIDKRGSTPHRNRRSPMRS